MRLDVLFVVILLVILVSIQLTLNKILVELRIIKNKIDDKEFEERERS
ncbi:hypothetical protein [Peptoniphilus obesi]|nr:hypothetical protein [Peptoniphilus obesi]